MDLHRELTNVAVDLTTIAQRLHNSLRRTTQRGCYASTAATRCGLFRRGNEESGSLGRGKIDNDNKSTANGT